MATCRVLIAPLNWGLGHATRCLPIAAALRTQGAETHWASDGAAAALLRAERPADRHHDLPGYGIRHASSSAVVNGLRVLPGLGRAVRAEASAVADLHHRFGYDLILSDNRYGCRLAGVPSAILCHQLHLPLKPALVSWLPNRVHRYLLRRFDEVLVPDFAPPTSLAGGMSRAISGVSITHLGPVSRFAGSGPGDTEWSVSERGPVELAAILSGPEPARSRFEDALLPQLAERAARGACVLVRGLPETTRVNALAIAEAQRAGVIVHDFLTSEQLQGLLLGAEQLLVRPGYTTVMDLAALGRRALYVPTPGQPEQEVLAQALNARHRGVRVAEDDLSLRSDLQRLAALEAPRPAPPESNGLAAWAKRVTSSAKCQHVA